MSEQSMLIFNILDLFHNFEVQRYKKTGYLIQVATGVVLIKREH